MGLNHSPKIITDGLVLYLDAANTKSYPGSLGPELVTNASLTAVDGSVVTVTTNGVSLCNVVAGKSYVLRYTVSAYRGATSGTFRINGSAGNYTPNLIGIGAVGTYYKIFTANVSGGFSFNPDNTGVDLDIDFVSVKEMLDMSASTWKDLSGNGNNGTLVSSEFFVDNDMPYFRNLNNVSNAFYVSINDSTSINNAFNVTAGGWTIEETIWTNSVTYPECDAGGRGSIVAYGTGATGFDWNHGILNTSFRFGQSSNSVSGYEENPASFSVPSPYNSLNAWRVRNIVWDRSNNINSLFINGNFINSVSTPLTAGTSLYDGGGIVFGELYGWRHFGRRSSIKIYNRVLTNLEILQNFNALRGRYGL